LPHRRLIDAARVKWHPESCPKRPLVLAHALPRLPESCPGLAGFRPKLSIVRPLHVPNHSPVMAEQLGAESRRRRAAREGSSIHYQEPTPSKNRPLHKTNNTPFYRLLCSAATCSLRACASWRSRNSAAFACSITFSILFLHADLPQKINPHPIPMAKMPLCRSWSSI